MPSDWLERLLWGRLYMVRREGEREFYSQLHCRHTRRAISPSKLVPILSNTYNEWYAKENIHRQRKKQTNENKNKLCAHTITRQARTTSSNTILSMIILLPIIRIKMNERLSPQGPGQRTLTTFSFCVVSLFIVYLSCPRPYTMYLILLWHNIACLCWKCR